MFFYTLSWIRWAWRCRAISRLQIDPIEPKKRISAGSTRDVGIAYANNVSDSSTKRIKDSVRSAHIVAGLRQIFIGDLGQIQDMAVSVCACQRK